MISQVVESYIELILDELLYFWILILLHTVDCMLDLLIPSLATAEIP